MTEIIMQKSQAKTQTRDKSSDRHGRKMTEGRLTGMGQTKPKTNFKKLTLAITSFLEQNKVPEKRIFPASSTHAEGGSKRLFSAKGAGVLSGMPPSKTGAFQKKKDSKVLKNQTVRQLSISHPRVKKETYSTHLDSHREIEMDHEKTPKMNRDKTIPKIPQISDLLSNSKKDVSSISKATAVRGGTSHQTFKECINSISKKMDLTKQSTKSKGHRLLEGNTSVTSCHRTSQLQPSNTKLKLKEPTLHHNRSTSKIKTKEKSLIANKENVMLASNYHITKSGKKDKSDGPLGSRVEFSYLHHRLKSIRARGNVSTDNRPVNCSQQSEKTEYEDSAYSGLQCAESVLKISKREAESLVQQSNTGVENWDPEETKNELFDPEILFNMIQEEKDYSLDPYYLDKRPAIKWNMRAILIDWLAELAEDFCIKRSTYHYAIYYVDKFLQSVPVMTNKLQLVGLTCMDLATKLEEVQAFGLAHFAAVAFNTYTVDEIIQTELAVMKALKWKMRPPTLWSWASYFMCHWDAYVDGHPFARTHTLTRRLGCLPTLKKLDVKAYGRLRRLAQVMDCAILDVRVLQYPQRPLIAAILYIVLGQACEQLTSSDVSKLSRYSTLLLDSTFSYNELYSRFLRETFDLELAELLPSIQFVAPFFALEPHVGYRNTEREERNHYEEFVSLQTHCPRSLSFVLNNHSRE